jgi:carboxyl-terminal processing protease
MKRVFIISGVLLSFVMLFTGCGNKDDNYGYNPAPESVQKTNNWILENMKAYYYWSKYIPAYADPVIAADSKIFFNKLLYNTLDKWSYITDDYPTLEAELSGVPLTMGYSPVFYLVGPTKVIMGVAYVYPKSPAALAGLKRGDIIVSINNTMLDTTNYYSLFTGNDYSVQFGQWSGSSFDPTGESLNMHAVSIAADPSVYHTIIDLNGYKIGYLAYVEFICGNNDVYLHSLDTIFLGFKNAGISDLIVDLRYNPGGEISAALHLASNIAPSSAVSAGNTLITLNYNDSLQAFLESNNYEDNLGIKFENSNFNLDMSRVFFLTTSRTASASELVIIGLQPYMNVIQIGELTYGKYVGSWVIPDDDNKWAMMPIVAKYSNSIGFTDFIDGLSPNYNIDDNVLAAPPLGDISDPLISQAAQMAYGQPAGTGKRKPVEIPELSEIIPKKYSGKDNLILPLPQKNSAR